jgi:ribonucleoside-triphosphate reductase
MKTEVWSRVCGYHRPVSNWNQGKKEEFKDRKSFEPFKDEIRVRVSQPVLQRFPREDVPVKNEEEISVAI